MSRARRRLLLGAAALLLVLAQPVQLGRTSFLAGGPLGWIALAPLWLAVRDLPPREAFRMGYATAFVAFGGMLFWIFVALNRYGGVSAPISTGVLLLFCGWLALFPAGALALARAAEVRGVAPGAGVLPVAWGAGEALRGTLLTGFPWALLGHSQWHTRLFAQTAEIAGVPGLSMLMALVAVSIAELASTPAAPRARRLAAFALGALTVSAVFGFVRVRAVEADAGGRPTARVALSQGNISQDEKHDRAFDDEVRRRYAAELAKAEAAGALLDVWPEATFPAAIHVRSAFAPLKELPAPNAIWLLAGAATWWDEHGARMAHNSALLIAPGRHIAARYDKQHLVPFGEYVPLPRLLFFVKRLTHGAGSFVPGDSRDPIPSPAGRIGVLICYEDVFPDVARDEAARGADLLATITNDAWYGRTSAAWQHTAMDVFRAIETRRPVVRAAQTGVSAFVDASGAIRAELTPFVGPASLVVDVPRGGPRALYPGELFAAVAVGLSAFAAAASRCARAQNAR